MYGPSRSQLALLLLSSTRLVSTSPSPGFFSGGEQVVISPPSPPSSSPSRPQELSFHSIHTALELHDDPVDALIYLQPDKAAQLAEPRLLHVFGEAEPQWMTDGDKLRLHRQGKKFADITDHYEFYEQQQLHLESNKPKARMLRCLQQPPLLPLGRAHQNESGRGEEEEVQLTG